MAVLVNGLRTLFFALACLVAATVVYTVCTDGLPFRLELLTPWMAATLVDFYINIFAFAVWICYKESNIVSSVVWVILLICFGRTLEERKGHQVPVVVARIVFTILGCLMVATLVYTILTDGSPFRKELLTPWMWATLIDFYANIVVLSVWVAYKETSWFSASAWIILLICFGSATTCAYIASQLFQLSSQDPLYRVLLKKNDRTENRYERT